jgi:hypothetical protein
MFTFDTLWKSHPEIFGDAAPCRTNGSKNFSDQCAINLGVALRRAGADMSQLRSVRHCWQHPKSEGHILAAEELAKALSRARIPGLQGMKTVKAKTLKTAWKGSRESFSSRTSGAGQMKPLPIAVAITSTFGMVAG